MSTSLAKLWRKKKKSYELTSSYGRLKYIKDLDDLDLKIDPRFNTLESKIVNMVGILSSLVYKNLNLLYKA